MSQQLSGANIALHLPFARDDDHQLAFGILDQVSEAEVTFPFRRPAISKSQKRSQATVGRSIGWIDRNVRRAIGENDSRADDQAKAGILLLQIACGGVCPDDA